MKTTLLTIAFAIATLIVSAQSIELDATTGKYQVQAVEELSSNLSKDELFTKAKQWIALNYKSANDVIQLADQENGKIICRGNFSTNLFMKKGWIEHTMILDFKDGKMRYTFTDFVYTSPGSGDYPFESKWAKGYRTKAHAETEANVKGSVASLKDYLAGTAAASDNDW
ncbi:DUF4468 domain-containing protein [Pontibacter mangrovi]|uniref:DUF4468 domain-containing protein n=1 Tax=Pontibacter mangrovi TaxID=2589816 RepID=A0A501W5D4_9BACT|nr:DUF4468 domain-containing protein [Pontibacter mangrovi]TPE43942.1 DUF4468 domain-containing protein [Pontibacter mangrovi]